MSEDAPSAALIAGQLGYLFEDEPELRRSSDQELARRLSEQDRFARAREKYPLLSDPEIRNRLDEFAGRITAELVHAARTRVRDPD